MKHTTSPLCSQELWPLDHRRGQKAIRGIFELWELRKTLLVLFANENTEKYLCLINISQQNKCSK
jgi:hypothetical protein